MAIFNAVIANKLLKVTSGTGTLATIESYPLADLSYTTQTNSFGVLASVNVVFEDEVIARLSEVAGDDGFGSNFGGVTTVVGAIAFLDANLGDSGGAAGGGGGITEAQTQAAVLSALQANQAADQVANQLAFSNAIATQDKTTSITNVQNFTGVEDGVTTFYYNIDTTGNSSKGAWISFISEQGTGTSVSMTFTQYASGNLGSFGNVTVYDDFGNNLASDTVFTSGRYWFKAAGCGRGIQFTVSDNGSNPFDVTVSTHLEAPFSADSSLLQAINNQTATTNASVIQSTQSQQVNLSFIAAIAAGGTSVFSFNIASNIDSLELNVSSVMATGTAFYVEWQHPGNGQWNLFAWHNPSYPSQAMYCINYPSTYVTPWSDKSISGSNVNIRVTNIGFAAIPVNMLRLSSHLRGRVAPTGQGTKPANFKNTIFAAVGGTTATLTLPTSLHFKTPQSIKVMVFRGAPTNVPNTYTLGLGYVNNTYYSNPPATYPLANAGSAVVLANQLVAAFYLDSADLVNDLANLTIVRTDTTLVDSYLVNLVY